MLLVTFQNNALHIYFDTDDAEITINILKKMINQKEDLIDIPLFTLNQKMSGVIKCSIDDNDYIYIAKQNTILWLSSETIESAIHKLTIFIKKNTFSPPELCESEQVGIDLKIKSKRKSISVYFLLKNKT